MFRVVSNSLCRQRLNSRRLFHKTVLKSTFTYTSPATPNGHLFIDFKDSSALINLSISSAWQDHYEIECSETDKSLIWFNHLPDTQGMFITLSDDYEHKSLLLRPIHIKIVIPEYSSLTVWGSYLNIVLSKKVHGNVIIECEKDSTIEIDKIRGEEIKLRSINGSIIVKKALEGKITKIDTAYLSAKMMNVESLHATVTDQCDIGALYVQQTSDIIGGGIVNIHQLHGQCNIRNVNGPVNVTGLDGNVNIDAAKGDVTLQINKLSPATSRSNVHAVDGHVTVKINPEVIANMECISSSKNTIQIASESFVHHQSSSPPLPTTVATNSSSSVSPLILANTATAHSSSPVTTGNVTGTLTGRTSADFGVKATTTTKNSKDNNIIKDTYFDRQNNHSGSAYRLTSGKINISQGAQQAITSTTAASEVDTTATKNSKPFLLLNGSKSVTVESLSWMEVIRRKHGLGNNGNSNNDNKSD